MALLNHNSAGGETQSSFDPIPNSWYNVLMTDSEMKPTKAGDGNYLECVLKVIDGDFAGRLLWLRLNLDNPSEQAVEIAYTQLNSICAATGVIQVGDSSELHNIPFQVKVVVRPPKDDYEASNEIKGFKAVEDGSATIATTTSAKVSGDTPAWQKKDKPVEKEKVKPQEPDLKEEKKEEVAADTTIEKSPEVKEEAKQETAAATSKPPWMQ